jgi:hypothetical protein
VRPVFGWSSIIVFGWDSIMSSSALTPAPVATISLSDFQTSSPMSSPKTFDMILLRTFE